MKKTFTRTLSLFLVTLMFLSAISPGTLNLKAASLTQSQFDSKLQAAKSLYPQGAQKYEWSINGSVVGWQCHGYARWLSWYVWGVDFANGRGTDWTLYKSTSTSSYINSLVPGDVVRYRTSTSKSYNHTIFITSISGDTVYFTDCNSDGANTIKWSRSFSKSTLDSYLKVSLYGSEASTYGYIAHYIPNNLGIADTCYCSTSYAGDYTCTVKSGNVLYIRNGHSSSYSIIGSIPSGATVQVTKGDGSWAHVTYNGVSGYASMEYLQKIEPTQEPVAGMRFWVTDSEYGDTPSSFKVGNRYYLCYQIIDKISGKPWNEVKNYTYTVEITFYNPNGSVLYSATKNSSDDGWISVFFTTAGTYSYGVKLTGDFTYSSSKTFTVQADPPRINASKTNFSLMLGGTDSTTINTWSSGYHQNSLTFRWEKSNSNVSCVWGDWAGDILPLTINANSMGSTTVTLKLLDSTNNAVLDTLTIKVTVDAKSYTVSYNANGGTGAPSSQTKYHDTTLTLTTSRPSKEGYTFRNWNTDPSGTGSSYSSGDSYTPNESDVLYAQWKPNTYTVYFNVNGGSCSTSSKTVTYDSTYGALPTPTKSGAIFKGWYTSDGKAVTSSTTYKIEGNSTLYAQWENATVTKIAANTPNKTTYYVGDSLDTTGLKLTVTYSDGSTKTVTSGFTTSGFSSSTAGTKTVTVSYGGKSTTFTVKVIEPSISINTSGKTLKIGESFTATATTTPSGQSVTWKTGNTSVATVSNGKITAVGEGSVSIYATFTYNGIKYETKMSVTVEKPETVLNSVSIESLPNKTVYYIGDTINTSGLAITAKYSDGSVKTVTTGLTVSGFDSSSKGTKTVTVSYGGKTTSFEVTVKSPSVTIALDSKSLTVGDVYTLSVTAEPVNADLMWSSGDTNIATVSNGKVTAKSEGEVIIKAKLTYNGITYSDTCTVKVTDIGCKHKYTHVYEAVDSTCTTQGHGKYIVCDDCKIIISGTDEKLPLLEHIPGEYTITREPTYNVVGIEACFCTECGKQLDRRQIPILEYQNKFTDVKSSHWFWESVNYVARKGYMSGMSETKFSPLTELTREQFIQILFAMEGKNKADYAGATGFIDVSEGKWYSSAIKWAKQEKITEGVGNGKFGLGANITREQMAKFMMSFAQYRGYNTDIRGDISTYKDVNKIASWSKEAMQWCVGTGIYESTSATQKTLEPRLTVKRAVAATVIMRFVQNTGK